MKHLVQFVSIVVLVALLASLGACAPKATPTPTKAPMATSAPTEAPTEEVVEIRLMNQLTEGAAMQPLLVQLTEEYEAKHPNVKVNWEWAGWEMFEQKLQGHLQAGEPPDMVWNSVMVQTIYARDGLTVPLDEYLSEPNWEGDSTWLESFHAPLMDEAYIEDAKEGAGYYLIPVSMSTGSIIFYNKRIFDEQGIQIPKTWSELLEVCEKLKAAGITPFTHDGQYALSNVRAFMYVATRLCGEEAYYDTALHKPGSSWADNPCWEKAAEEVMKYFGYCQEGFLGSKWPSAQVEFSQSLSAMHVSPDWLPAELVPTAPEGFEMSVFRFPAIEGGKGDQTATESKSNGYGLLKDAKHPREALDFMKFLSSRYAMELQAEQYFVTPPTRGSKVPDSLAPIQEILAASKLVPFGTGIDTDAPEWRTKVLEPLLAELALGKSPADFVAELQMERPSRGRN